jgi:ElaB/YqjD/DUF883 family membrane-anchored ribosome-binding protein
MFLKVKVLFEVMEGNNYTLNIGNGDSQIILQFSSDGGNIREELLDVPKDDENVQVSVLSEGTPSEVEHMDIPMKDIIENEDSEWLLEKEHFKMTIFITRLDEVPEDWFESGIAFLAREQKPWYLTAEDLYKCTKDIMAKLTERVSARVSIPAGYWDEILQKLDFVTSKVAEKLLQIKLEEGFSLVAKIDELLEQVLSSTDEKVDENRLKLALKLQQLRKNVTVHLHDLSQTISSKSELYRTRFEDAVTSKKEELDKTVATAYVWASDKSSSTSNWLAQAEHTTIVNKIDALRLSGKSILEETQNRMFEARDKVVNKVTDTRDQVVNSVNDTRDQVVNTVQTKLSAADEALRVQLPVVAHPYVIQAVNASQPYVQTAVDTASPLVQTVRDQESVKKLESWIMDKKKDELLTLLEKNKDTPAGSMVSALLSQASRVITEVSDYCLNDDYFERNHIDEINLDRGENESEVPTH